MLFDGTPEFARFIDGFIKMASEAEALPVNGRVVAWVVKAAFDAEQRRAQWKFMSQALRQVLGPQEWDLGAERRRDDTSRLN